MWCALRIPLKIPLIQWINKILLLSHKLGHIFFNFYHTGRIAELLQQSVEDERHFQTAMHPTPLWSPQTEKRLN